MKVEKRKKTERGDKTLLKVSLGKRRLLNEKQCNSRRPRNFFCLRQKREERAIRHCSSWVSKDDQQYHPLHIVSCWRNQRREFASIAEWEAERWLQAWQSNMHVVHPLLSLHGNANAGFVLRCRICAPGERNPAGVDGSGTVGGMMIKA